MVTNKLLNKLYEVAARTVTQVNSGQLDILWNFAGNKIHANTAFL